MADRRYRPRQAVSAGGVVYRPRGDGIEILLLKTPKGVWGLPKGTPDEGESLEQTAGREVREETGLEVELEERIGAIEYWFARPATKERLHKFVHFWLMRPTGGSIEDHDDEHVSVKWFPLQAALRRVTHDNAADILEQAADILTARKTGAALHDRASR